MTDDHDRGALRLLRADLDDLAFRLSQLDRGSRHQLAALVADLLDRLAGHTTPPAPHP